MDHMRFRRFYKQPITYFIIKIKIKKLESFLRLFTLRPLNHSKT